MTDTEELAAERLARQLYRALERSDPDAFIGAFPTRPGERTTIDGSFNLISIARKLLPRLEQGNKTP